MKRIWQKAKLNSILNLPIYNLSNGWRYVFTDEQCRDRSITSFLVKIPINYSGEDSDKQLDFLQTDISRIYLEFQKRGIKCC